MADNMKINEAMPSSVSSKIVVLDAGGQYCHLIARKIRELGVYAEIKASDTSAANLTKYNGIIISGGPASVFATKRPDIDKKLFRLGIPILGICYGHQLMAETLGGRVTKGQAGEYGLARMEVLIRDRLFKNLEPVERVWMNHRDVVDRLPNGFSVIAKSNVCEVAAMANFEKRWYGVQFHPEVVHTSKGKQILQNFVRDACGCSSGSWRPQDRISLLIREIRAQVGNRNIFFMMSGGVDSTVAFLLCVQALGKERVLGFYVDTGFMRKRDGFDIDRLATDGLNIRCMESSELFFGKLAGCIDPERKRRIIGRTFIDVANAALESYGLGPDQWLLGQGTIYPDTIESGDTTNSARIKTHHNRVGLIKKLLREGKIVEPLKDFYKDEVREVGRRIAAEMSVGPQFVEKQPFPGPGLAIRCLATRDGGAVLEDTMVSAVAARLSSGILMLRSVGVRGDERSYAQVAVLGGDASREILEDVSTAITNNIAHINRVTYLLSEREFRGEEWQIRKCFVTRDRIERLRAVDDHVMGFIAKSGLASILWQFPVIVIPLAKRGSSGDTVVLRPVESVDGMTAQFSRVNIDVWRGLARELMRYEGVEAVMLDVTNKPPATIEWE